MSGPFGSSQWMYNTGGDFYPTTIDNSLRFEGKSAPSYLSRTFTAGSNTTWTFSWWFKPDLETNNNGTLPYFFATSGNTYIRQQSGEGYQIEGNLRGSGGTNYFFSYAPMLRDPSAWYHCVIAIDTTQGTSSNRIKFYLNGEQQTNAGGLGLSYPPLNHNTQVNTAVAHRLGAHPSAPSSYAFSGYMAEINFVDGTQLDASSFGETKSGIWIPKAYSGSYGTNGFHLEFAGNANDSSGNGNNWTANNISAHDYVPDSPTNNFATFNPLDRNSTSITTLEGNLRVSANSSQYLSMRGTMSFPQSGKWYMEFRNDKTHVAGSASGGWGIQSVREIWATNFGNSTTHVGVYQTQGYNSAIYRRVGSDHLYGLGSIPSIAYGNAGDIQQIAFDCDSGKIWFGINNTWMGGSSGAVNASSGDPSTGANPVDTLTADMIAEGIVPMVQFSDQVGTKTYRFNAGQDSTFQGARTAGGNADANGYGDFAYAPPSGFLSMCHANMPELAIDPANDDTSGDHFGTALWTGNGTSQSITVGFQADFIWAKDRSATAIHILSDAIRGPLVHLSSHDATAEAADDAVRSFDTDGFTSGNWINTSSNAFVSWNWKAGGTAVSNTDGSITSSVSANPTAGFSIVNYVGTGTNDSYGHGLGVAPKMIITKDRTDPANWAVYVASVGTGKYLQLNLQTTPITNSVIYPTVTSTTIGVGVQGDGSITNTSGDNYISYCFANVEGHQKIGSYVGNGSSDGQFINCGFRPAFIMFKSLSSLTNWELYDVERQPYNVALKPLYANHSYAEEAHATLPALDILSNGFKPRSNWSEFNSSGHNYIYLAIAEQPFKYANAR